MPIVEQSSYRAPLAFGNGHLQTVYPTLYRPWPQIDYTRERIETSDGDFLDLDWAQSQNNSRLVILTHGLESSSSSKYICGMAAAFKRRGWDALAWNLRGCSGETNRLLTSYHSGSSDDLSTVIDHVVETQNYETIALIGFSLGGNITLKYLGEAGANARSQIQAAAAFSVATDLASSAKRLEQFQNRIYMRRFMKTLTEKVRVKMKQFPGKLSDSGLERMRTFSEFDGTYTAPLNGFASADDYWSRCSSGNFLDQIQVPTLLVNAVNDPFLTTSCYPTDLAHNHQFLHLETPASGGHMGFVHRNVTNEYWSETRAAEFIEIST